MKPTLQDALNHGARLLGAGQLDEAEGLADELVRQFPESQPVRLFAADTAGRRGDVAGALAHLDALSPPLSDHAEVLVRKARLLFADGRRADALQVAQRASTTVSSEPRLMRMLAGVLRDCQALESAHQWL
ncbi:MAG TPA: tetratricopeptide repeat protein, partial [Pseudomonadales bacterium]